MTFGSVQVAADATRTRADIAPWTALIGGMEAAAIEGAAAGMKTHTHACTHTHARTFTHFQVCALLIVLYSGRGYGSERGGGGGYRSMERRDGGGGYVI